MKKIEFDQETATELLAIATEISKLNMVIKVAITAYARAKGESIAEYQLAEDMSGLIKREVENAS